MLGHIVSLADQSSQAANTGTWLDQLALGGGVTVLGMVVVFMGLISLIVIMWIYPKFVNAGINSASKRKEKAQAKKDEKSAQKKAEKQTVVLKPIVTEAVKSADDHDALIAVITAAVAASLGTSTNGIRIKSIERTGQNAPAWGARGRIEQVYNRF